MITTQQIVDVIDTISTIQGASVAINRLIKKELLKKKSAWKACVLYTSIIHQLKCLILVDVLMFS